MVRCHLSRLMGERRVRIADVARATGISRNQLARLYYDRARRVELADLETLCRYFNCALGALLEIVPEQDADQAKPRRARRRNSAEGLKRSRRAKRAGGVPPRRN